MTVDGEKEPCSSRPDDRLGKRASQVLPIQGHLLFDIEEPIFVASGMISFGPEFSKAMQFPSVTLCMNQKRYRETHAANFPQLIIFLVSHHSSSLSLTHGLAPGK